MIAWHRPHKANHKMMRLDLERARKRWIEEAENEEERRRREQSDFLCYCDGDGLFADFHSKRVAAVGVEMADII